VVQSPADADFSSMPERALAASQVDYLAPADGLAMVLDRLIRTPAAAPAGPRSERRPATALEGMAALDRAGGRTTLTCPDCGGTLWEVADGGTLSYHCHVGHAFGEQSFIASHDEATEGALWSALRALEESVAVRRKLARRAFDAGQEPSAARFSRLADEAEQNAGLVRRIVRRRPSEAEAPAEEAPEKVTEET
jgi:two-component system chemotaxis response regulator CheB